MTDSAVKLAVKQEQFRPDPSQFRNHERKQVKAIGHGSDDTPEL